MTIQIGSIVINDWQSAKTNGVEFRVWCDDSFIDADGLPHLGGNYNSIVVHRATCAVNTAAKTLTIPSITLPSTTDAHDHQGRKYYASIVSVNGNSVVELSRFSILPNGFKLGPSPTTTTWDEISNFNVWYSPNYDISAYPKDVSDRRYATAGSTVSSLTGDVTGVAFGGAVNTILATVNSNVGTFTNPTITVDAKGRILAASIGTSGVDLTTNQTVAGNKSFTGITRFGGSSLVTETAWGNFDGSILMAGGADSSLASPSSSVVPSLAYQTYRSTSTNLNPIIAYGFASYQSGGYGDLYGIYSYATYTANMSGFPLTDYNKHAVRGFLRLNPSNVPAGAHVHGYAGWFHCQREVTGVDAIGAQIDANNLSGSDAEHSDFSILNKTMCITTNAGEGDNLNTAIIFSEGRRAAAYAVGWKFNPNAIYRRGFDFKDAYVTLVGTLTATNGSAAVTGSGTKFLKQAVPGDALQINGVYSVVASVADDTHLTLAAVFTGTTFTGDVTKYVIPMRLATNSAITAHSDNSNVDYRAFHLAPNDVWNFDPDARGTIFGGNIGFGVTSASNPLHLNSGSSVAVRIDGAGNQQTTIGAAGGASALPATPLGYLKVSINNFVVAIPYYLPS